jgi:hypothetical protein
MFRLLPIKMVEKSLVEKIYKQTNQGRIPTLKMGILKVYCRELIQNP